MILDICKINSHVLRRGVIGDERQSFLQAIVSIVEREDNPITKSVLKNYLFNEKLKNERLFNSLNNGELKILFFDKESGLSALENYKKYMMDNNEKITEEFLIDFLSRPNVLFPEGLNIFLLDSRSILCPQGFNAKEFYKKNRKSIFIYTDGRYYEPIYKVTNKKGELIHEKLFLFSNTITEKIFNMVVNNCETKQIINWEKIRKENLRDNYYQISENLNSHNIFTLLNKNKIGILGQIKDKYNKSIGFMTKYNFPVFFLPMGEDINIDIVDKWKPQTFRETYNFYYKISQQLKIPHLPIRVYKNNDGYIVAILLENNSIIPVKPTQTSSNLMEGPGKYYYDVDNFLYSGEKIVDERTTLVQYVAYLQESYERVRFEISRTIQNNKLKDEIYDIINSDKKSLNEKRTLLRSKLKSILKKLCVIVKTLPFNIDNYIKPKIRTVCESYEKNGSSKKVRSTCNGSFHCYFTNGKCKLLILEKNPIDKTNNFDIFLDRVTEEILRNKFLRDEIMEDKIEDIIDKNNFNLRPNQIALTGASDILEQIKKIYEKKKTYYINPADMYSTVEPKYYGVNKNKYLIAQQELTIDSLNLNYLPSHWIKIFKKKYKYYDEKLENNSMYLSLIRILSDTDTPIRSINQMKSMQIEKIEQITKSNINKEKNFKNINAGNYDQINRILSLYKKYNGSIYKNINTFTDLKSFILLDDYPANEIDAFLLSMTLGYNIIILDRRITKANPKGFKMFLYSLKKDFIFLFEQKRFGSKRIYSPVNFNGKYVLKKKEMLPYFLEGVSSKNLNNNNVTDNTIINNKKSHKKIKIKKKVTQAKNNSVKKKIKIKKIDSKQKIKLKIKKQK